MKYIAILGVLLLSSWGSLHAQIDGIVKDSSGEPIASASIHWANTTHAEWADDEGKFSIKRNNKSNTLITTFIGFNNDTTIVDNDTQKVEITLTNSLIMKEVEVVERRAGLLKSRISPLNLDLISSGELVRAACCNLGESFTTNPSVDVSSSDASTGAKQIKLLGLSGSYVQLLTENIPNYRGSAQPFSLGYIPGPWIDGIQISKGNASVKNGYEAITGQINVETKKPQTAEELNLNLFVNSQLKTDFNADANIHLNNKLSTSLLAHYENSFLNHDNNNDGFIDMPKVEQFNVMNRWAWMGDKYKFQAGIKVLKEERTGGEMSHNNPAHEQYKIDIDTRRYEVFAKNAYIINPENGTNVALMLSGSLHNQDSEYGRKRYNVDQKNGYASLIFESNLGMNNSISTGLSLNHDNYKQSYNLINQKDAPLVDATESETVAGGYVQYTYNLKDKLTLMGGLRTDYSSIYGTFVTPRVHAKYAPSDKIHFRASVGKGYKTNHVLAENNYLLASSREFIVEDNLKQESAWNYGVSTSLYLPIFGRTLNLNAEYFYTDFDNQLVADFDSNAGAVRFANLQGKSFSHTFQIDASYMIFKGMTLTAAYRLNDVKSTYGGVLMKRPLTSDYKGLLTASYKTPLELWQFDLTLQMNGGGRMPTPYTLADGSLSWNPTFNKYAIVNVQATRWFRKFSIYAGGENITNFKQKNPIIGASSPFGPSFDSTMVWGPVEGAMFYAGIRFNIPTR